MTLTIVWGRCLPFQYFQSFSSGKPGCEENACDFFCKLPFLQLIFSVCGWCVCCIQWSFQFLPEIFTCILRAIWIRSIVRGSHRQIQLWSKIHKFNLFRWHSPLWCSGVAIRLKRPYQSCLLVSEGMLSCFSAPFSTIFRSNFEVLFCFSSERADTLADLGFGFLLVFWLGLFVQLYQCFIECLVLSRVGNWPNAVSTGSSTLQISIIL